MMTDDTANMLFITLDSCRWDTAVAARTPALDGLGPLLASETSATFTLPAHWAFFSGFLPRTREPHLFLGHYERLWRSQAGRSWSRTSYVMFDTPTVIEHYARSGRHTAGLGGVPFFDPKMPSNSLPALFPTFFYNGERAGLPSTAIDARLPERRPLPTKMLGEFTESLLGKKQFFGFINFSETHFPYCTPGAGELDEETQRTLREIGRQIDVKRPLEDGSPLLEPGRLKSARDLQVQALEWIDLHLKEMFGTLAATDRETVVVVCADHGESFGERGLIGHGNASPEVARVPMWVGTLGEAET
uniref:Putative arylsulfatase n=1 Tax=Sphaerisporangium sp. SANK 60911 TaxID=1354075 RepID=V5YT89_9ACTN|nr:putative arylsulfatase [Sphaerisporangium sp. SANK 60911]